MQLGFFGTNYEKEWRNKFSCDLRHTSFLGTAESSSFQQVLTPYSPQQFVKSRTHPSFCEYFARAFESNFSDFLNWNDSSNLEHIEVLGLFFSDTTLLQRSKQCNAVDY